MAVKLGRDAERSLIEW